MDISEEQYKELLSFQINYEYTKDDMMNKINNIPFTFFDVKFFKYNYIVDTSFPLINEILDDIFRYIVVNKDFEAFKSFTNNQGNAFSSLFEYKVRCNFSPKIKGIIKYFNNFDIEDNVLMDIIIPADKDGNNPKFI